MIERAYASIEEGQVHLRRSIVAAETPPLIMLHASPASSRSLEPLIEALGDERSRIAFDTPCNGQSCAPAVPDPDVAHFAGMLRRALGASSSEGPIALYGTHTGAHIAIEWARAEPERVKALVLDGVALWDEATKQEFLDNYAPQKAPDQTGSQFHWAWHFMRDQMIFFPYFKKGAEHIRPGGTFDAHILHNLTLDVLNNLETYHMPYHAVFQHDVRAALPQISAPVLVLGHEGAPLDDANRALLELLPDARTAETDGSPQGKAAAIGQFLAEIDDE